MTIIEVYLSMWSLEGDAESRVRDHLPGDDEDALISSENPRIILASANFSKELTTSVLWLNQVGLNVTCIQLQPHKVGDSVFVERGQVIPVPKTEEYTIRLRNKETERQEAALVRTHSGAATFLENIQTAIEKDKLERLCKMAVDLEDEGLAVLSTRVGTKNVSLRVELPGVVLVWSASSRTVRTATCISTPISSISTLRKPKRRWMMRW